MDDYPAEPEQPLYDDVDQQQKEPEPEGYYDSAGYGDQEPDQPMYDDVQGTEEQQGGGGGGVSVCVWEGGGVL